MNPLKPFSVGHALFLDLIQQGALCEKNIAQYGLVSLKIKPGGDVREQPVWNLKIQYGIIAEIDKIPYENNLFHHYFLTSAMS